MQEGDSLDEKKCSASGHLAIESNPEGVNVVPFDIFSGSSSILINTDEEGRFEIPEPGYKFLPGTYVALLGDKPFVPGKCFILRDTNGNIKLIQVGPRGGTDLGEVFASGR